MTLTTIEKAAKLMGVDLSKVTSKHPHLGLFIDEGSEFRNWFNPYTNKADLSDVIDELAIAIYWDGDWVSAFSFAHSTGDVEAIAHYVDHPNNFTAKAHAVMAVVEQIYDRREG